MTSTGPPRLVLLPCVLLLLLPVAAPAETLVVRLVVNGEAKADVFAERTADGDFLVRPSDLAAAGLREPKGTVVEIGGEPHLSLRSIRGVRFAFDEKTLSLNVTAAPEILPAQTIDFAPRRQTRVSYPKDTSAFLNYRVGYTAGDSFSFRSWDAAGQAGLRTGDVLFLTDFSYTKTPSEESLVRLQSSAACDRRETMQRAVAGDVFASSGDLGGSVNLGGASFSKVYRINPYFLRHPLANVSGLVALPSDVEIRLDGMLLRTEKLPPGPFELTNLDYYGGASRVTVVIKDPFGREERLAYPFYFTDVLLRKGLHEYSYNAGFLREDFGVRSNRYGAAAFSVFHNYGVSDALTVGARAEGGDGMANLGPQAFLVLPKAGVLSASVSLSRDGDRGWGAAALLGYSYQDNATGARLFAKGFSTGYAVLGEGAVPYRPKYEAGAGAGYGTTRTGSVSLDLGAAGTHGGPTRRTAALTYSRKIADSATLFASYRKSRDVVATDEAFAGITYALSPNASVSASYKGGDGVNTETAQVQKYVPAGEGYGFRAQADRIDGRGESATAVNPFVQYNGRHAVLTGEYRGSFPDRGGSAETYQLTASGGIATVGGAVGLSRPVTDSFGLVVVDNLAGVRVSLSNQEIGRTDAKGRVFVPTLGSYYENQVAVNDRDIPIDYSVAEVLKYVSPPLRSGSVIRFEAKKLQAVTGRLSVRAAGEVRPVEFVQVRTRVEGRDVVFPTGRRGEFYLENAGPGTYRAAFDADGKTCEFDLTVPASGEAVVDLGGIVCETLR